MTILMASNLLKCFVGETQILDSMGSVGSDLGASGSSTANTFAQFWYALRLCCLALPL